MKIKHLRSDRRRSSGKRVGDDRPKLSDREKETAGSDEGVLAAIMEAARIATEEVIKRRKAAAEELARWRKAAREESLRLLPEENAPEEPAGEESVRLAPEENAPEEPAGEESVKVAPEETAEEKAAEEKAAKKAAKKQKAAEEAARWVAESIRALGDSAELNGEDAVTAAQNICGALDWKFLKNLTGCQIEYGTDEDFSDGKKAKIKKSDDLTGLEKKLEAGKKYYVRVRLCAALKDKKHCSDWSEVITLKA